MEDYVTYEQAVKLKELGFDWGCTHNYNEDRVLEIHTDFVSGEGGVDYKISAEDFKYSVNKNCIDRDIFDAPTLAQVAKWLRKKWNFLIYIYYYSYKNQYPNGEKKGCFWDYLIRKIPYPTLILEDHEFDTYESALSAGIDKALELIEEK